MPENVSLREKLRRAAQEQGFVRFGIAAAEAVPESVDAQFSEFIAQGRHGEMDYLEKYSEIRRNPSLLLDNARARSIIAVAASYYTDTPQPGLRWARYALGKDYHDIIRLKLGPLKQMLAQAGFQARICVDTAPLYEKYWAVRAGIGTIGMNSLLLTPAGSYVLLGFIVTDAELPADRPLDIELCTRCGACVRACPGKAIDFDGINASKCNSYLTIESRGELPENLRLGKRIYGCDICQEVCPVNRNPTPARWEEFLPNSEILSLTPEKILSLTPESYSHIFRGSAIKRAKLAGLLRNLKKTES